MSEADKSSKVSKAEPATTGAAQTATGVGSVFVSNYPPYSVWSPQQLQAAHEVLAEPAEPGTPLGLYLHIPFCRRRCKFCYFKVYTDKNSKDVERYMDALAREVEILARKPRIAGRPLRFIYFGGGTPSFISARHLRAFVDRLRAVVDWDAAEEIAFECEPGTLTESKLETIREIGVTRLSLGVENFDDEILKENGRAHVSREIYRVAPWVRALNFDQLNIDLIAGMVGETWETWRDSVRRTVEMQPDSVTVYQMELPYNTVFSQQVLGRGGPPLADWPTKREWHDYAFEQLADAGYEVSSAYTMTRKSRPHRFVYRDSVWRGCDLLGTGVASFSHVGGVHYQNVAGWDRYLSSLEAGELAFERGLRLGKPQRLIREWILQLKLGAVDGAYFVDKFGTDPLEIFGPQLDRLESQGMLTVADGTVRLTRTGLLQVDSLLPHFYEDEHRGARYT